MENKDTGLLLDKQNIELQRTYFKEMVTLLGINTIYKQPETSTKTYSLNGDLEANYKPGIICGCIFEEHPTIKTMRRLGWNTERADSSSVIHVPFDLPGLQRGAQFIIPSPFDATKGRVFRVIDIKIFSFFLFFIFFYIWGEKNLIINGRWKNKKFVNRNISWK